VPDPAPVPVWEPVLRPDPAGPGTLIPVPEMLALLPVPAMEPLPLFKVPPPKPVPATPLAFGSVVFSPDVPAFVDCPVEVPEGPDPVPSAPVLDDVSPAPDEPFVPAPPALPPPAPCARPAEPTDKNASTAAEATGIDNALGNAAMKHLSLLRPNARGEPLFQWWQCHTRLGEAGTAWNR
jgi:hypothetical protein